MAAEMPDGEWEADIQFNSMYLDRKVGAIRHRPPFLVLLQSGFMMFGPPLLFPSAASYYHVLFAFLAEQSGLRYTFWWRGGREKGEKGVEGERGGDLYAGAHRSIVGPS